MVVKKYTRVITFSLLILLLLAGIAYALPPDVRITGDEVFDGDRYAAGLSFINDGTIKGDLVVATRDTANRGTVEGDILGACSDFKVSGTVLGDIRIIGGTLAIDGKVGKNTNLLGGNITVAPTAVLGENLIIFGGHIDVNGKIGGNTIIGGRSITLGGEFNGNVTVYNNSLENEKRLALPGGPALTVLPGTIIRGKLTYHGSNANISDDAEISGFKWVKPGPAKKIKQTANYVWKFIRLVLTTAIYFFMGLIFYKLFPAVFIKQAETIARRPFNVIGAGIAVLFSTMAAGTVFVILLLLSIRLISPAIGLVFGAAAALAYILIFYFANIPVAMWLGNLLCKENMSAPYRFGSGLAILTLACFILNTLAEILTFGRFFSLAASFTGLLALLTGTGAWMYTIGELYRAAKRGEA